MYPLSMGPHFLMKAIELKGHSGCRVTLLEEGGELLVRKSSANQKYNSRLSNQIKKQKEFNHHYIKSPSIFNTSYEDRKLFFDMEFIKGKSFSNFIEREHYKNIELSFLKIINFVKQNNSIEETIEKDVRKKIKGLNLSLKYQTFKDYCLDFDWNTINKSYSHGDLTFENIIVRDGEIFFIDFLDSFTSSQVLDYSKLMQDIVAAWSWRKNLKCPFINLLFLNNILKDHLSTNMLTASHKMLILNLLRIIPYSKQKEENFIHSRLLKLKQQKI